MAGVVAMTTDRTRRDACEPAVGMPKEGRAFLSPRHLAERWSCSRTTAQRIAARAGITRFYLGEGRNGMVRYPLKEVIAYEEARRVGTKGA